MTPSDTSGRNKSPSPQDSGLTGVDRLFGRDLRSQGWVLKLAPIEERPARPAPETDGASEAPPDPAMIWALRWRRR